jgi:DNA-binding MarR family transcriptional regulator
MTSHDSNNADQKDLSLGQLMVHVCKLSGDRIRMRMEEIGLHRGQGFILRHLWHDDGISQKLIARALHIRPASVTNALQRMEKAGWIERRADEADHRVSRVFLTAKARELHDQIRKTFRELEEEILEPLSEMEREALRSILQKVHRRLLQGVPEERRGRASWRRHRLPDAEQEGEA